jgi:hypothetical protein
VYIPKTKKRVQDEAEILRSSPEGNAFEIEVGNFWSVPRALPYLEATHDLARLYWGAATQSHDAKEVWELCLYHHLEHPRLGILDRYGTRLQVPFVLLSLNRDDDASTFIHTWIYLDSAIASKVTAVRENWPSSEGEWVYHRQPGCRYSNVIEGMTRNPHEVKTAFLVALAIIKLRIVAAHEAAVRFFDRALKEKCVRRTDEEYAMIKELIREDFESQQGQSEWLLKMIHTNNPSMLPALIDPKPLLRPDPLVRQPIPDRPIPGHPSEVLHALKDCTFCFYRVPGAVDILIARFGTSPTYNCDLTSG